MLMVSDRTKKIIFSPGVYCCHRSGWLLPVLLLKVAKAPIMPTAAAQMKDFGWRVLNFAVLVGILGLGTQKS